MALFYRNIIVVHARAPGIFLLLGPVNRPVSPEARLLESGHPGLAIGYDTPVPVRAPAGRDPPGREPVNRSGRCIFDGITMPPRTAATDDLSLVRSKDRLGQGRFNSHFDRTFHNNGSTGIGNPAP